MTAVPKVYNVAQKEINRLSYCARFGKVLAHEIVNCFFLQGSKKCSRVDGRNVSPIIATVICHLPLLD